MPQIDKRPMLASASIALLQLARIAWLSHLPTGLLVQRIPDDAFYYLVLGQKFATKGRWTFDGVAPSSGFHLVWGYLLAALSWLAPTLSFKATFVLCSLFACLLISTAVYLLAAAGERLFGAHASWGTFLVFSSAIVLVQGSWLMESPIVLFFGAACLAQIAFAGKDGANKSISLAFALGCLGSLSRSDFGLLPFWLTLATFAAVGISPYRKRLASAQLIGAVAGVLIVFGHTYLVSAHLTQASAQVKLWWTHLQGRQNMPVLHLAENIFNPTFNLHQLGATPNAYDIVGYKVRQVVLLAVCVLAGVFWKRSPRQLASMLLLALLCCCLCYGIVYSFDGAVQDWYVVSFVPAFCLLSSAAAVELSKPMRIPAVLFVAGFAALSVTLSVRAHAPWQEATYQAGLELKRHPEWSPVGSWNSGVMSYFGDGKVVNLDGLVNDDLLPYIQSGTLARYFASRHVTYLIESPNIFTGTFAKRSGLEDGAAASCIDQHRVLFPRDRFDNAYGMHLELFHMDAACIASVEHVFRAAPVY